MDKSTCETLFGLFKILANGGVGMSRRERTHSAANRNTKRWDVLNLNFDSESLT